MTNTGRPDRWIERGPIRIDISKRRLLSPAHVSEELQVAAVNCISQLTAASLATETPGSQLAI